MPNIQRFSSIKLILPLILFFFCSVFYQFFTQNTFLSDDLAMIIKPEIINNKGITYFNFIAGFLNTHIMTSRPVSGFIFGSIIYLSKYSMVFYYVNYLFFLIGILMVFKMSRKLLSTELSLLTTFFYSFSIISSSMSLSAIMMNANLAIVFYALSFLSLFQKSKYSYLLSLIFWILSVLSYEIFFPAIFVNLLTIKNKIKVKILYILTGICSIWVYRELMEPIIFSNYFHRDKKNNLFDLERDISIVIDSLKMFFIDIPSSTYRSIIAIKYYSLSDIIICLLSVFIFALFLNRIKNFQVDKKVIMIGLVGIIFSFFIFFISEHTPNLYEFFNRNLGSIRLFSSLLMVAIIAYFFKTNIKVIKIVFFCMGALLIVNTISIKNGWIYASKFNDGVFISLKKHLNDDNEIPIYLTYDFDSKKEYDSFYMARIRDRYTTFKNGHFILKEPIYSQEWESYYLKKRNNIDNKLNINYYYSSKKKPKIYYLYDFKLDTLILNK